jgi:hypothetical protein
MIDEKIFISSIALEKIKQQLIINKLSYLRLGVRGGLCAGCF